MECCGACCKLAKGLLLPLLKRSSQTLLTLTFAFTVFTTYIIVGQNARLIFFSSLFSNFVCSSCRETIKAIYGSHSKELDNFNRSLRSFEQLSWSNLPCLYCTRSFKPLSYSFFTLFIELIRKVWELFLGDPMKYWLLNRIWAIILLCHKEKGLKKVESWSSMHVHSTVQQYDTTSILDTGKIIKGKAWLPFTFRAKYLWSPFLATFAVVCLNKWSQGPELIVVDWSWDQIALEDEFPSYLYGVWLLSYNHKASGWAWMNIQLPWMLRNSTWLSTPSFFIVFEECISMLSFCTENAYPCFRGMLKQNSRTGDVIWSMFFSLTNKC